MKSKSDSVPPVRPSPARRSNSGGESASEVFGFTVDENQFAVLQSEQIAASQREVGLVDPRTTRHLRWSAQRADDNEAKTKQAESATVQIERNTQGTSISGTRVDPGVSVHRSKFFDNSFPAYSPDILSQQSGGNVQYLLESGAAINVGGYLYSELNCNKWISNVGPDWSVGRPGHTPTRRILACEKTLEDRVAG